MGARNKLGSILQIQDVPPGLPTSVSMKTSSKVAGTHCSVTGLMPMSNLHFLLRKQRVRGMETCAG